MAQIQFKEDLNAVLVVAHDWNHPVQAGEVQGGSEKVAMTCSPREISKNGFSLKSLIEMPFAD